MAPTCGKEAPAALEAMGGDPGNGLGGESGSSGDGPGGAPAPGRRVITFA
ncbi:hypothetical protein [Nonomuraea sp. NPDC050783]